MCVYFTGNGGDSNKSSSSIVVPIVIVVIVVVGVVIAALLFLHKRGTIRLPCGKNSNEGKLCEGFVNTCT
jgi:flagellar basal body-associated protein FliL